MDLKINSSKLKSNPRKFPNNVKKLNHFFAYFDFHTRNEETRSYTVLKAEQSRFLLLRTREKQFLNGALDLIQNSNT